MDLKFRGAPREGDIWDEDSKNEHANSQILMVKELFSSSNFELKKTPSRVSMFWTCFGPQIVADCPDIDTREGVFLGTEEIRKISMKTGRL